MKPRPILAQVVEAVRGAGRLIEETRASGFTVQRKGPAGPVTEADRRADRYLHDTLLGIHAAAWLSEETEDDGRRLGAPELWVVDPLDGTREFSQGIPEYSVSVALLRDERAIIGVVHNPATGDVFWASEGEGAFRNGVRLHTREDQTLLASRSEVGAGEFAPLAATWSLRAVGSIALKLALVAAGEAGGTLSRGPKHDWDVCAGALLVQEAGGLATDAFGAPLLYNQRLPKVRGILAGAPQTHGRALAEVRRLGPSARMAELDRA